MSMNCMEAAEVQFSTALQVSFVFVCIMKVIEDILNFKFCICVVIART